MHHGIGFKPFKIKRTFMPRGVHDALWPRLKFLVFDSMTVIFAGVPVEEDFVDPPSSPGAG